MPSIGPAEPRFGRSLAPLSQSSSDGLDRSDGAGWWKKMHRACRQNPQLPATRPLILRFALDNYGQWSRCTKYTPQTTNG